MRKGSQLLIEGKIQTRTWDDRESGQKKIGPKFSFTTSHCWAAVPKTKAGPPTGEVMPEREASGLVMRDL